jgi:hypothetical protein
VKEELSFRCFRLQLLNLIRKLAKRILKTGERLRDLVDRIALPRIGRRDFETFRDRYIMYILKELVVVDTVFEMILINMFIGQFLLKIFFNFLDGFIDRFFGRELFAGLARAAR